MQGWAANPNDVAERPRMQRISISVQGGRAQRWCQGDVTICPLQRIVRVADF
jgi:hypothetical protein